METTVALPRAMAESLDLIADQRGLTREQIVHQALSAFLSESEAVDNTLRSPPQEQKLTPEQQEQADLLDEITQALSDIAEETTRISRGNALSA